ncbi:hypothetical protein [Novosphingopyxis sp.]|uniref:hypothetical protein n=1 Tax=Novosphingopyxis sp. TaxID=2709690 RepID=UPI003B5C745F
MIARYSLFAGLALGALATPAIAQDYGTSYDAPPPGGADPQLAEEPLDGPAPSTRGPASVRTEIQPYIEIDQVAFTGSNGQSDVVTYTTVAAGVDARISERHAQAGISARYERLITYDDDTADSDYLTGLAAGSVQLARGVSVDAGALAARSRVNAGGAAPSNLVGNPDNISQLYSVYAGPTVGIQTGGVTVGGAYRFGYTRVEDEGIDPGAGVVPFDESTSHSVSASVGQQPGGALPIGWAVGGGYDREDGGALDNRFEDAYGRVDVTVPVSPTVAVVGGAGYENIRISERDAVRDANGVPIIDDVGRLVVDRSSPRLLSYEQDGFIWDVGVLWRPSRRTSLEARVGQRYGSESFTGSFSWQPNERTSVGIAVYDSVTGYGSLLRDRLAGLPTDFTAYSNPLTGDVGSCAFGSRAGTCFDDVLQSASGASFRSRGVTASYATDMAGWKTGLALGYNRRTFLTADEGAQAFIDGTSDRNYFANAFVSKDLDALSSVTANLYANYYDPGFTLGEVFAIGANAGYNRSIWRGLDATAALGVDYYDTQNIDFDSDEFTASALLGLRYSF